MTASETSGSSPGARSRKPGRPREDWIRGQLKRVYDQTVREDIPDEMLDLLRQLDSASPAVEDDAAAASPQGKPR